MSELKKIRDFKAPKDDATADELRRQLVQFESNVSDMGDTMTQAAMQRLTVAKTAIGTKTTVGLIVAPGQSQAVDTRTGTVPVALAKPTAADAGTFIVLIDLGGSAGSLFVQGQGCKIENAASAILTAASYAILIFCDGSNYWRLS